jgi:hypothetical protein
MVNRFKQNDFAGDSTMLNRDRAIIIVLGLVCVVGAGTFGFNCGRILNTDKRIISEIKIGEAQVTLDNTSRQLESLKKQILKHKGDQATKTATSIPEFVQSVALPSSSSTDADYKFYDPSRPLQYKANDISLHSTRGAAIAALAEQFGESSAWVEAHMGNSNDLREIHKSLATAWLQNSIDGTSSNGGKLGKINYSLVDAMKTSWQKEGWRYKTKSEQAQAMALILLMVNNDCPDPYDREATLDYIEKTIGSW